MKTTTQNIDTYLSSLPDNVRQDMQTLDAEIASLMTGESRKLWVGTFWGGTEQTIIGYGDLVYTRSDKQIVEWFKIGLALQKNYISIYVSMYPVKKYPGDLGRVRLGASNISFKNLSDLNLEELRTLITLAKTQAV